MNESPVFKCVLIAKEPCASLKTVIEQLCCFDLSRANSRYRSKSSSAGGHEEENISSKQPGHAGVADSASGVGKSKRRTEDISVSTTAADNWKEVDSTLTVTSCSSAYSTSPRERRKLMGHHHYNHRHHGGALQRKGAVYDHSQSGEPDRDRPHLKPSHSVQAGRPVIRSARDLLGSCGDLSADVEAAIKESWEPIVGNDFSVVVAQLAKFKEGGGLGISLEGTVDVEDGVEVRPHHYIRSILPDGPVGINGRLKSSDELLEVNGRRLLGLNHVSVVEILKDLPQNVRLVCARRKTPLPDTFSQPDLQIPGASSPYLPGVESGPPLTERLVKAKSEMALSTTSGAESPDPSSLNRAKSRSLEPLTGLAMWSSQPVVIELEKGDRGLGFSILDYQDPVNPTGTVIVIRSLVPGGIAQQDGRLVPGDRLVFVNDVNVEHATLDQAVQALKGAARGMVRIGVAKPLPLAQTFRQDGQFAPFYDSTITQSSGSDSQGNEIPPNSQVGLDTSTSDVDPVGESAIQVGQLLSSPALHNQEDLRLDIPADDPADQKSVGGSDTAATSPISQSDTSSGSLDRSGGSNKLGGAARTGQAGVRRQDSFYESDEEDVRTPRSTRKSPGRHRPDVERPPGYNSAVAPETSDSGDHPDGPRRDQEDRLDRSPPPQATGPSQVSPTIVSNSAQPLPSYEEALTAMTEAIPTAGAAVAPMAKLDSIGSDSEQPSPHSAATFSKENISPFPPGATAAQTNMAAAAPVTAKKTPPPIPPKPKGVRTSLLIYAQEKEAPPPLPASTPPPVSPNPPLTPPLRPAPSSPKWGDPDYQHGGRSGLTQRKSASPSPSPIADQVNPSDLSTPPASPRHNHHPQQQSGSSPASPSPLAGQERTIHIQKANLHLGLTLEAVDKAVNGCAVKSIARPSAAQVDGRLQPGDHILSVNNESLKRITSAQARAILRRCSLLGSDISSTSDENQKANVLAQTFGSPKPQSSKLTGCSVRAKKKTSRISLGHRNIDLSCEVPIPHRAWAAMQWILDSPPAQRAPVKTRVQVGGSPTCRDSPVEPASAMGPNHLLQRGAIASSKGGADSAQQLRVTGSGLCGFYPGRSSHVALSDRQGRQGRQRGNSLQKRRTVARGNYCVKRPTVLGNVEKFSVISHAALWCRWDLTESSVFWQTKNVVIFNAFLA
ncbi:multiple pdz domain protein [Plakobranchus ocellatus]|uniref:Multiple pdz domain protein n=1 Tax=Plakobranchus ocellatus TaxID=259542 RepID=A0AAV4BJQ9_9GAST|nr:multiple pdz domain protein [Plakobranchus ocellatus]